MKRCENSGDCFGELKVKWSQQEEKSLWCLTPHWYQTWNIAFRLVGGSEACISGLSQCPVLKHSLDVWQYSKCLHGICFLKQTCVILALGFITQTNIVVDRLVVSCILLHRLSVFLFSHLKAFYLWLPGSKLFKLQIPGVCEWGGHLWLNTHKIISLSKPNNCFFEVQFQFTEIL